MTKKTFFLFALALVFALAPSLEAQNTISWAGGRTLLGRSYSNDHIYYYNAKLRLGGGGDIRVVSILDGNGRVTGKTTIDKIQKNPFDNEHPWIRYRIKLTGSQYLELSGTQTERGGFEGHKFYVIMGPTELILDYTDNWPIRGQIGFSSDFESMVYEDWAGYKKEITGQFVDKYILPMVSYDAIREAYNEVRFQFWEYTANTSNTDADKECPEWIACICGGNIVRHIIYTTAMKLGLMGGILEAIPDAFGGVVGDAFGDKLGVLTVPRGGENMNDVQMALSPQGNNDPH